MSARPVACGLVLSAVDGKTLYCEGEGKDRIFVELLRDEAWLAEARQKRLMPIETGTGRFAGLLVPGSGAYLLVLHRQSSDIVFDFLASVDFAYDIFRQILSDPFDALTVVDDKSRVAFISPVHETFSV